MKFPLIKLIALLSLIASSMHGLSLAQTPPARDFEAEIEAALREAKAAAGVEFLGTLSRICLLPASGGENTSDNVPAYVTDPGRIPPRESWYADPIQVFDNLYFVGGKVHSAWALTTSEGIIIIDTLYPYNSREAVIGGLEKLGLDPEDIRYVIISHAHGDHIGGAQMLQERFNAQVVMGEADWELVEKYPNRYATMAPTRNASRGIVGYDGMEITLGDTTVTLWETPGHTPGTLSYTFTVFDNGRPVNVAYSGGTAFNFVNNTPIPGIANFQTYIQSQAHIAEQAAVVNASVILSNHSEFDNAVNRNRMLAGRGDGPHPYELGAEQVQNYFQVMQSCARAAQLRLEERMETEVEFDHAFPREGVTQLFDNERVTAWRVNWIKDIEQPYHKHRYDMAGVYLRWGPIRVTRIDGTYSPTSEPFPIPRPYFQLKDILHKEEMIGFPAESPERLAIMFDLKEVSKAPVQPAAGMPLAFPRAGAEAAIDNHRVTEWVHSWNQGESIPLHLHDKDSVQVFFEGGTIQFTNAAGAIETQTFANGDTRFIPAGTIDAEVATSGTPRAVTIELK